MTTIIDLLNEDKRPKAPPIEGATDAHRRRGRHLAMIHAMHLEEMDRVRHVITGIETGEIEDRELAAAIAGLTMTENYRVFGSLCGRECQALTFHHTAEDRMLFPMLRNVGDGLRRVVEKLMQEHEVVHALIETLDGEARRLLDEPGETNYRSLKAAFEQLDRAVRSHFGYEQTELEEAIGYYGVPI
ncbi:MAG: hemerythrin domain-containing protein [Oricola sp.]